MAFGGSSRWKAGRALPIRLKPDGTPAKDPRELAVVKLEHFAQAEAAVRMPFDELASRHQEAPAHMPPAAHRSPQNVATMREVITSFAHSHTHKAVGMDGVPADLFKAAPAALARLLHPVYTKVGLNVREPLAFKGAVAIDLYKGKGQHQLMPSYRSILV